MTPPSLDVLLLNLGGIVQQIQQAATQARRARFHGAPDMVSSVTDACSLSEVVAWATDRPALATATVGTVPCDLPRRSSGVTTRRRPPCRNER